MYSSVVKLKDYLRRNLVKRRNYEKLVEENETRLNLLRAFTGSSAEYFQDLWVLMELGFKQGGFFVEFGATNGVDASNTYLLERKFQWRGILVEPNFVFQEALRGNRNSIIDNRLVWDVSNKEIDFLSMTEAYISVAKEDLKLVDIDLSTKSRVDVVNSVSLNDLLINYCAPDTIDFISVDVEGSEYRILKAFFEETKFKVRLFVVEHNWREDANLLLELFEEQGYELVFKNISNRDFWFRLKN